MKINVFSVDYSDVDAVVALARSLHNDNPRFHQYVMKYPGRNTFTVTMQQEVALKGGAAFVYSTAHAILVCDEKKETADLFIGVPAEGPGRRFLVPLNDINVPVRRAQEEKVKLTIHFSRE